MEDFRQMRQMRSECENTALYVFLGQNLIEYDKRKICSKFEKFLISGLPTAEGQKSQINTIFAIFDPLRLAIPISEIFQTCWTFFFCHTQSDFGHEKCIEQCFHTRSASALLKRKSSIDLTWKTLGPLRQY